MSDAPWHVIRRLEDEQDQMEKALAEMTALRDNYQRDRDHWRTEVERLTARVAELEATPVDWDAQRRRADELEAKRDQLLRRCDRHEAVGTYVMTLALIRDYLKADGSTPCGPS